MKKIGAILFLTVLFGVGEVSASTRRVSVGLRVEPQYFSPNQDEFQDNTFFFPVLQTAREVLRWRLEIVNEKGRKIQRLHGAGFPALVKWDGRDKNDNISGDGKYEARLIVWGADFKASSPWVAVYVDNSPPFAALSVSSTFYALTALGENKLVFTPNVEDISSIANWEFRITDGADRAVHVAWSSGTLGILEWDGTNKETGILSPRGSYRCSLQVTDAAGNRSLPAFVDVEINVSARELLQRVLRYTPIYETEMGLVIQLPLERIFDLKKNTPVIKKEAEEYLREAAIIVNAYPDVPVHITGYARRLKSWEADRTLSSLIGWDVYRYLVKQGKVLGSRMRVNGRGRSPTFSRRQYDDPPHFTVLKNGVEIILEGQRDWSQ